MEATGLSCPTTGLSLWPYSYYCWYMTFSLVWDNKLTGSMALEVLGNFLKFTDLICRTKIIENIHILYKINLLFLETFQMILTIMQQWLQYFLSSLCLIFLKSCHHIIFFLSVFLDNTTVGLKVIWYHSTY